MLFEENETDSSTWYKTKEDINIKTALSIMSKAFKYHKLYLCTFKLMSSSRILNYVQSKNTAWGKEYTTINII